MCLGLLAGGAAGLLLVSTAPSPAPAAGAPAARLRASATPSSGPPGLTLAVRCAVLIDGVADEPAKNAVVLVEGERIRAVGTDLTAPPGVPVLDLSGMTCLPGLIDMHTHLTDLPGDTADLRVQYGRTLEEVLAIGRRNAEATLRAGFTTVRDVGTYHGWSDRALRDAIDRGETPGPRMQVAAYYLTIPGGGGDLVIPGVPESEIPAWIRLGVARGPQAFRAKAEEAVAGGADFLKVIASGAVLAYGGIPGEPEMTPAEIAAVAEVAHGAGKKLAAHAHGARSVREAILSGADTIEHASLIDDEGIRLAKERAVALSMDVYNGDYIASVGRAEGWPEEFLRKNEETTGAQRQAFVKAYRVGAAIVYGTDAAVYPHGENARQFPIMVGLGMAPMDAIRAATSVAARHMGWEDRAGALQPGRYADLIAVAGDPLADISLLEDVPLVLKGGTVVQDRRPRAPSTR